MGGSVGVAAHELAGVAGEPILRIPSSRPPWRSIPTQSLRYMRPMSKLAVGGLVVLVAAVIVMGIVAKAREPGNPAEAHVKRLIDGSSRAKPKATLAGFEMVITGEEWKGLSEATRDRVGAEVVRIAAAQIPKPFTPKSVDDANRVVARYRGLPEDGRTGAARETMLTTLEGWLQQLQGKDDREARIALLRLELEVANGCDTLSIGSRLATERLEMARSIEETWPVDALGFLAEEPRDPQGVAEAGRILGRLIEQPALLVDAGKDVDAWLASVPTRDPQRMAIEAQRELGRSARTEDDAETDAAKMKAALAKRPWDQWLVVKLATADLDGGDIAAAEKRLQALGGPGLMIRDATFLYGRLALAQGQLETADNVLSGLLGSRLQRFLVASAQLDATGKLVKDRVIRQMQNGNMPPDVLAKLEKASEAERASIFETYFRDTIDADPGIAAGRAALMNYGDVVPASIGLGMVKLRRAQSLGGPARDAMLGEAERAFLTVRTAAVGQPEYHLGLGEIYARLGKAKESEAELVGLLGRKDSQLTLRVASTYRTIGNQARATAVATDLYNDKATEPAIRDAAAALLGIMGRDDEERETWLRRSDIKSSQVRTALLEIEGRRLLREGKRAECDKKFAEAARLTLEGARPGDQATQNNAALATQQRFQCTGDVARLREAEAALESAYRSASDQPIVASNLATLLRANADLRILAKRIDITALRLDMGESRALVKALLDGPDRATVLAELTKDPGWRRSGDLFAQVEVLMPSSPYGYYDAIDRVERTRDPVAADDLVARLRRAKSLDTSSADEEFERRVAGTDDKIEEPKLLGAIERDKEILSHPLDAKTRAAALLRSTDALLAHGVAWNHPEEVIAARAAYAEVTKRWPALSLASADIFSAVDDAALAADGARWATLRRARGSASVLTQLVRDKDPLADKIRGSAQWPEIVKQLRARTGRPDADDLVLARLTGDATALAWANAAVGDKVLKAVLEARAKLTPKDPRGAEGLAALAAN